MIQSQVDRAIKRSRNCYHYAVFRLVAGCIFRRDCEVIVCSVRQTGNSNLTLTRCKVGVYFIRCIYHMVTCYLFVIRCRDGNYGTVNSATYQTCTYHYRSLFITACPLCSIHFELKQLHPPFRSSLRAPEADVTDFCIIVQICPIVVASINASCAYKIVTQIPIAIVFREINVIQLRASALKMQCYQINIIECTKVNYKPAVIHTRVIHITICRRSLPYRTNITIHSMERIRAIWSII